MLQRVGVNAATDARELLVLYGFPERRFLRHGVAQGNGWSACQSSRSRWMRFPADSSSEGRHRSDDSAIVVLMKSAAG